MKHNNERPHKCDIHGCFFKRKGGLSLHNITYDCEMCHLVWKSKIDYHNISIEFNLVRKSINYLLFER